MPLVVGGKLYVLNEKSDGTLRLFTLEVRSEKGPDETTKYSAVVVPPVQILGTVAEHHRVTHDISRRATAVHLAYGEGILVCPTNAGQLLGVDLVSRTLAWAYPYRQTGPDPRSQTQTDPRFGFQPPGRPMALTYANWKVAPPVITDGKVVFTAPDSIAVHCINLRDGTQVWSQRQMDNNDLFFAGVFDGKVLIVGKNSVRAYSLAKGDLLWTVPTGDVPSGQGVASKNIYYLPLQKGEIIAIDVARGVIKAHNRSAGAAKSPGNLVFYEGAVLSQTIDEVVAYPQLTAKLEVASKAVTADPDNLEKRTLRGELLLRDGQIQNAVEDLRTVWKKKPQGELHKRVRQQLYDAFTDLMQTDFKHARTRYLDEYKELCRVPDDPREQELREAKLLRILGQGLESEGDLVGAFKAYRQFGSLPLYRNQGIPSVEDPAQKIPSNVWLRGRVMNMLARATAEQRQPLEARIGEEWQAVQAKEDVEAVRSFVGMFDVPFAVGRAARLRLAELIIANHDRPAYLEAELNLEQLLAPGLREDAQVGGRALDSLARLEISKGTAESMRLAFAYYKDLAAEFPRADIRDGKTGDALYKDLFNDKRFLAYLSEGDVAWPKGEIKARKFNANAAPGVQGFLFEPRGDVAPFLRQYRLVLDRHSNPTPVLRVLDLGTHQVLGEPIPLGTTQLDFSFYNNLYNTAALNQAYHPDARFRFFHAKGHLAVVQVGPTAYGIDLSSARLLWRHPLLELTGPQFGVPNIQPDADGNPWLLLNDRFGAQPTRTRVGGVGAVEASYVALTTHKGLVLLDPLRGTPLWSRPGVRPQTEVFGDGQHLYLVTKEGDGRGGPSQVLRASDGTPLETKSFSYAYGKRIRRLGRKLLVADPADGQLTLRLYDPLTAKDLWKKSYDAKAVVVQTEDPYLTGVIEPNGDLRVVDLHSEKEVLKANLLQGKITQADLGQLHKPLLLADRERFYVALNTPVDNTRVMGGVLANNFTSGLRCAPVNGWFCAVDRKTGEFLWHVESRTSNQMVVLEQFRDLPIILFSVRYNENQQVNPGGPFVGARLVSHTLSVDKESGRVIYGPTDTPDPRMGVDMSQFYTLNVNPKAGTINLVGPNKVLQHYVNDGRKLPEDPLNGLKGAQMGGGQLPPGTIIAPRLPDPGAVIPNRGGFGQPKGFELPPPKKEFVPRPGKRIGPAVPPKGGAGLQPLRQEMQRLRLEVVPGGQAPALERPRVILPADR